MLRELLKQKTYVKATAISVSIGFLTVLIFGFLWAANAIATLIPTWIGCGIIIISLAFLITWGFTKDMPNDDIKRGKLK